MFTNDPDENDPIVHLAILRYFERTGQFISYASAERVVTEVRDSLDQDFEWRSDEDR